MRWPKNVLFIVALGFSFLNAKGQEEKTMKMIEFGVEAQGYLKGLISGVNLELGFKEREAVHIRAGYNFIRARGLEVHDNEQGGGFGFTAGYRHYFRPYFQGFVLGVRNDVWFNSIDWLDHKSKPDEESGNTDIVVIEPTFEGGYKVLLKNEVVSIMPTIALGFEINAKTSGEEVGSGIVLLVGLVVNYRGK